MLDTLVQYPLILVTLEISLTMQKAKVLLIHILTIY